MNQLHVQGGYPLRGSLRIPGAKNAALPLMAASLLTRHPVHLTNIPHISDIDNMANILLSHGVAVDRPRDHSLDLRAADARSMSSDPDLGATIRSSILVLGPLLARFGHARFNLPGGCQISTGGRPVDLHVLVMRELGAVLNELTGEFTVPGGRLRGARIRFDKVSVGATENALMAACLARGKTTLENAAMNPEISDLVQLLRSMGARIEGVGTNTLKITGVESLSGAQHSVVPDRIVAGTYAVAALMTKGDLELYLGSAVQDLSFMDPVLGKLREAGAQVLRTAGGVRIRGSGRPHPVCVTTGTYPDFPTDMQPQWVALMCLAHGSSVVTETIFDQRFHHVAHLQRMGARIQFESTNRVRVQGVEPSQLRSATVKATDLRAAAALLLTALAFPGNTVIQDIHHLERGYEDVVSKVGGCGGRLQKM